MIGSIFFRISAVGEIPSKASAYSISFGSAKSSP